MSEEPTEITEPTAEEVVEETPATEECPEKDPAPQDRAGELEVQLLRMRADFDNFRKRTQRDKENWNRMALEPLVIDLLTVLDHFELGLQNAEQHEAKAAVADGFRMVFDQYVKILEKYGLQLIPAENVPFDPSVHEAVTQLPSDEIPEGHTVAQTRKGYTMNDKLIRAAQVVVSSGPAQDS